MATFTACTGSFTPAAAATDIWHLTGVNMKTIRISELNVSALQTNASILNQLQIVKRVTSNTGGTTVNIIPTSHDSSSGTSTAVVQYYTVNPVSTGTLEGVLWSGSYFQPSMSTVWDPNHMINISIKTASNHEPFTLRSSAEQICLSNNGAALPEGASNYSIRVTYTEA
jgi:hypothetical protein